MTHDHVQTALEKRAEINLIEKLVTRVKGPVILKPSYDSVKWLLDGSEGLDSFN